MTSTNQGKGRGWHGDREGHARAGSKGGRARGRARSGDESATPTVETSNQ